MKSPYQILFGEPPNYEKLRVFGCLCFPWLRPYNNHKLQDKSQRCIFLGYSTSQSAYFCLEPTTQRIYMSRHVHFVESEFPYRSMKTAPQQEPENTTTVPVPIATPLTAIPQRVMRPLCKTLHQQPPPQPNTQVLPPNSETPSPLPPLEPTAPSQNESQPIQTDPSSHEPTAPLQNESQPTTQNTNTSKISHNQPAMSLQPTEPQNLVTEPTQNVHRMKTRAKNNISKPVQKLTLTVEGTKALSLNQQPSIKP